VSTGLAPRRTALRVLERVSRGLPLDAAFQVDMKGLEERDRRLAHELVAGVLRQQTAIDGLLALHVQRGLLSVPPLIRGILRLGVYQLEYLDRVPAHATVSTSVDLAREVAGAKAAGFVNAVLRKTADKADRADKANGVDGADQESVTASTALSARYSHPEWLVDRWLARFGPAETEALLVWNNRRPTLVVQPARESLSEIATRLHSTDVRAAAAPFDAGLVVSARSPVALPGFVEGAFQVQDAAQALVVRYAAFSPDEVVYDACAAPGGKTIALGRAVRWVIAGEARQSRIPRLVENLSRAGSGREFVVVADASLPPVRAASCLLDAPCLGTGTFARHPDARWRANPTALERLARRQADLLAAVARLVPVGGLLVYSTCSLELEENEVQIARLLESMPGFRRELPADFPAELLNPEGDLFLVPQRHGTDGAYAARLRKVA
jgi:16S rRNA (cytosine967-C5)-methyltransferase